MSSFRMSLSTSLDVGGTNCSAIIAAASFGPSCSTFAATSLVSSCDFFSRSVSLMLAVAVQCTVPWPGVRGSMRSRATEEDCRKPSKEREFAK